MAPLAIGLSLTLIHLISIPVSNTAANPARFQGVAIFPDGDAHAPVRVFFLAPLAGAAVAGLISGLLFPNRSAAREERPERPTSLERENS
ncbi:aquaporin [Bacillus subtilis]|nr:aquaporin [Bacillus subtilis]